MCPEGKSPSPRPSEEQTQMSHTLTSLDDSMSLSIPKEGGTEGREEGREGRESPKQSHTGKILTGLRSKGRSPKRSEVIT